MCSVTCRSGSVNCLMATPTASPRHRKRCKRIAEIVDMERQCCPFLTFKIVVETAQAAMRLEVTGPVEAQKLIADYFNSASMLE